MEKVTTTRILDSMKEWVENKVPIPPSKWIEAAGKLNVFMGDESEIYYTLESELANRRKELLERSDMSVAKAKAIVEASPEYKAYRIQGAKIKQIEEFIRISKKMATITDGEFKGY